MTPYSIPFNQSSLQGRELEYIFQTVTNGQIAGDQTFSKRCQSLLEDVLSVKKTLVVTSCTHALEMTAMLLDIKPGDEVIIPSFTFVSTANAFVVRGATPVFCDVRSDTLNLNEENIENLISERTKAIVPVHYAGVGCEMDEINNIAHRHGLAVIEDNAHGLFGKYKGRWLGSLGTLATQSFHETKNITCGEGGALIINDENYCERGEIIREKGTNRARFSRGQVDKYSWVDIGSSYVMSDVLAAFLFGQLEVWSSIQTKRKEIWELYDVELKPWAIKSGVQQPVVPEHCEQAWHMYYLILPTPEIRRALIDHLKGYGVISVFHYLPLHISAYAKRWGGKVGDCPVTEYVSERLLRLPFYNMLTLEDQERVIEAILEFDC